MSIDDANNNKIAYILKKTAGRMASDIRQFWLVILIVAIVWGIMNALIGGVCPVPLVTGFPCPGCGMTRAVFYLLTGNLEASLYANPTAVLWIGGGIYFFIMRYLLGKKAPGIGIYLVVAAVVTAIVYAYRMYEYFPGVEPLAYHGGNLLETLIPWYGNRFR